MPRFQPPPQHTWRADFPYPASGSLHDPGSVKYYGEIKTRSVN